MIARAVWIGLSSALLMATVAGLAQTKKVVLSPDGALRAVIRTNQSGESRVQIQDSRTRVVYTLDQTSSDGSHGHGVDHAAWTADAQFLVVGTEATGGHQPWAHPIWFFSRSKKQFFELGKMGASAVSDFILTPPDVIEVKVLDRSDKHGGRSLTLVASLSQIKMTGAFPLQGNLR